jgi:hypothetical protein
MTHIVEPNSFETLKEWLGTFPNQKTGRPTSTTDDGNKYVEFSHYALSRPDDVEEITRIVCIQTRRRLDDYLNRRYGMIEWRIPLELDVENTYSVLRYSDDGPDMDVLVNRQCFKDKNWKRIKAYCRLYRAP